MTEVQTVTLSDFLLARIADDEDVANAATRGHWDAVMSATGSHITRAGDPEWFVATGDESEDALSPEDGAHVARHDPARVLAECEAKRRIVTAAYDYSPELEYGDNGEWAFDFVLRSLALPFADHPDYRQEWRP